MIDISFSALHHEGMKRTTIALEDDALSAARTFAERRGVSLGQAVSELIRRGATVECPTVVENGLMVLDPGPGAPRISSEDVYKALEEWP